MNPCATSTFASKLGAGVILVAIVIALPVLHSENPAKPAADPRLERGRYLVHQVGLCIDCHSPRRPDGSFVAERHLTGAPIPFAPTAPMPWMPFAPRLAGLPAGFSADDLARFLMTGERPNGRPPALPPMPPYRLDRSDAEAVAAYLKSLPTEP